MEVLSLFKHGKPVWFWTGADMYDRYNPKTGQINGDKWENTIDKLYGLGLIKTVKKRDAEADEYYQITKKGKKIHV